MKHALKITSSVWPILGGATLGVSSFYWVGEARWALCLIAITILAKSLLRQKPRFIELLIFSFATNVSALYWVPEVIHNYSGSGFFLSYLASPPLWLANSLTGPIAWGFLKLVKARKPLARLFFGSLAWAMAETLSPSLINFYVSSPLIDLPPLALLARGGGLPLVTLTSLILSGSILFFLEGQRKTGAVILFSVLSLCALNYFYCQKKIESDISKAKTVSLGIISPELSVYEDLKTERLNWRTNHLRALSSALLKEYSPDLLIWPESAFGHSIPSRAKKLNRESSSYPARINIPLLGGGQAFSHNSGKKKFLYNRAFVLNPDGGLPGYYDKQKLFPFSEKQLWPFKKKEGLFFLEGKGQKTRPIKIGAIKPAVALCYEDTYPRVFKSQTRLYDSNLLITITNDGWFSGTEAPFQHELVSRWRAIENGRFLVRATNLAQASLVSPSGKIIHTTRTTALKISVWQDIPLINYM